MSDRSRERLSKVVIEQEQTEDDALTYEDA